MGKYATAQLCPLDIPQTLARSKTHISCILLQDSWGDTGHLLRL